MGVHGVVTWRKVEVEFTVFEGVEEIWWDIQNDIEVRDNTRSSWGERMRGRYEWCGNKRW